MVAATTPAPLPASESVDQIRDNGSGIPGDRPEFPLPTLDDKHHFLTAPGSIDGPRTPPELSFEDSRALLTRLTGLQPWQLEAFPDEFPPLPLSRPSSPLRAPAENTRPTTPLPARRLSSTAVPIRFRKPLGSPVAQRDSTTTESEPVPGPGSSPLRPRHAKAQSAEFKSSREFRPLYLLERTRKPEEIDDALPALPSSGSPSRASSATVTDEEYESALETPGLGESLTPDDPFFEPLDVVSDLIASQPGPELQHPELAGHEIEEVDDSGQATPKASDLPAGLSAVSAGPAHDVLAATLEGVKEKGTDASHEQASLPRSTSPRLASPLAPSPLIDESRMRDVPVSRSRDASPITTSSRLQAAALGAIVGGPTAGALRGRSSSPTGRKSDNIIEDDLQEVDVDATAKSLPQLVGRDVVAKKDSEPEVIQASSVKGKGKAKKNARGKKASIVEAPLPTPTDEVYDPKQFIPIFIDNEDDWIRNKSESIITDDATLVGEPAAEPSASKELQREKVFESTAPQDIASTEIRRAVLNDSNPSRIVVPEELQIVNEAKRAEETPLEPWAASVIKGEYAAPAEPAANLAPNKVIERALAEIKHQRPSEPVEEALAATPKGKKAKKNKKAKRGSQQLESEIASLPEDLPQASQIIPTETQQATVEREVLQPAFEATGEGKKVDAMDFLVAEDLLPAPVPEQQARDIVSETVPAVKDTKEVLPEPIASTDEPTPSPAKEIDAPQVVEEPKATEKEASPAEEFKPAKSGWGTGLLGALGWGKKQAPSPTPAPEPKPAVEEKTDVNVQPAPVVPVQPKEVKVEPEIVEPARTASPLGVLDAIKKQRELAQAKPATSAFVPPQTAYFTDGGKPAFEYTVIAPTRAANIVETPIDVSVQERFVEELPSTSLANISEGDAREVPTRSAFIPPSIAYFTDGGKPHFTFAQLTTSPVDNVADEVVAEAKPLEEAEPTVDDHVSREVLRPTFIVPQTAHFTDSGKPHFTFPQISSTPAEEVGTNLRSQAPAEQTEKKAPYAIPTTSLFGDDGKPHSAFLTGSKSDQEDVSTPTAPMADILVIEEAKQPEATSVPLPSKRELPADEIVPTESSSSKKKKAKKDKKKRGSIAVPEPVEPAVDEPEVVPAAPIEESVVKQPSADLVRDTPAVGETATLLREAAPAVDVRDDQPIADISEPLADVDEPTTSAVEAEPTLRDELDILTGPQLEVVAQESSTLSQDDQSLGTSTVLEQPIIAPALPGEEASAPASSKKKSKKAKKAKRGSVQVDESEPSTPLVECSLDLPVAEFSEATQNSGIDVPLPTETLLEKEELTEPGQDIGVSIPLPTETSLEQEQLLEAVAEVLERGPASSQPVDDTAREAASTSEDLVLEPPTATQYVVAQPTSGFQEASADLAPAVEEPSVPATIDTPKKRRGKKSKTKSSTQTPEVQPDPVAEQSTPLSDSAAALQDVTTTPGDLDQSAEQTIALADADLTPVEVATTPVEQDRSLDAQTTPVEQDKPIDEAQALIEQPLEPEVAASASSKKDKKKKKGKKTKSADASVEESVQPETAISAGISNVVDAPVQDAVRPEDVKLPEETVPGEFELSSEDSIKSEDIKLPDEVVVGELEPSIGDTVRPEDIKLPEEIMAGELEPSVGDIFAPLPLVVIDPVKAATKDVVLQLEDAEAFTQPDLVPTSTSGTIANTSEVNSPAADIIPAEPQPEVVSAFEEQPIATAPIISPTETPAEDDWAASAPSSKKDKKKKKGKKAKVIEESEPNTPIAELERTLDTQLAQPAHVLENETSVPEPSIEEVVQPKPLLDVETVINDQPPAAPFHSESTLDVAAPATDEPTEELPQPATPMEEEPATSSKKSKKKKAKKGKTADIELAAVDLPESKSAVDLSMTERLVETTPIAPIEEPQDIALPLETPGELITDPVGDIKASNDTQKITSDKPSPNVVSEIERGRADEVVSAPTVVEAQDVALPLETPSEIPSDPIEVVRENEGEPATELVSAPPPVEAQDIALPLETPSEITTDPKNVTKTVDDAPAPVVDEQKAEEQPAAAFKKGKKKSKKGKSVDVESSAVADVPEAKTEPEIPIETIVAEPAVDTLLTPATQSNQEPSAISPDITTRSPEKLVEDTAISGSVTTPVVEPATRDVPESTVEEEPATTSKKSKKKKAKKGKSFDPEPSTPLNNDTSKQLGDVAEPAVLEKSAGEVVQPAQEASAPELTARSAEVELAPTEPSMELTPLLLQDESAPDTAICTLIEPTADTKSAPTDQVVDITPLPAQDAPTRDTAISTAVEPTVEPEAVELTSKKAKKKKGKKGRSIDATEASTPTTEEPPMQLEVPVEPKAIEESVIDTAQDAQEQPTVDISGRIADVQPTGDSQSVAKEEESTIPSEVAARFPDMTEPSTSSEQPVVAESTEPTSKKSKKKWKKTKAGDDNEPEATPRTAEDVPTVDITSGVKQDEPVFQPKEPVIAEAPVESAIIDEDPLPTPTTDMHAERELATEIGQLSEPVDFEMPMESPAIMEREVIETPILAKPATPQLDSTVIEEAAPSSKKSKKKKGKKGASVSEPQTPMTEVESFIPTPHVAESVEVTAAPVDEPVVSDKALDITLEAESLAEETITETVDTTTQPPTESSRDIAPATPSEPFSEITEDQTVSTPGSKKGKKKAKKSKRASVVEEILSTPVTPLEEPTREITFQKDAANVTLPVEPIVSELLSPKTTPVEILQDVPAMPTTSLDDAAKVPLPEGPTVIEVLSPKTTTAELLQDEPTLPPTTSGEIDTPQEPSALEIDPSVAIQEAFVQQTETEPVKIEEIQLVEEETVSSKKSKKKKAKKGKSISIVESEPSTPLETPAQELKRAPLEEAVPISDVPMVSNHAAVSPSVDIQPTIVDTVLEQATEPSRESLSVSLEQAAPELVAMPEPTSDEIRELSSEAQPVNTTLVEPVATEEPHQLEQPSIESNVADKSQQLEEVAEQTPLSKKGKNKPKKNKSVSIAEPESAPTTPIVEEELALEEQPISVAKLPEPLEDHAVSSSIDVHSIVAPALVEKTKEVVDVTEEPSQLPADSELNEKPEELAVDVTQELAQLPAASAEEQSHLQSTPEDETETVPRKDKKKSEKAKHVAIAEPQSTSVTPAEEKPELSLSLEETQPTMPEAAIETLSDVQTANVEESASDVQSVEAPISKELLAEDIATLPTEVPLPAPHVTESSTSLSKKDKKKAKKSKRGSIAESGTSTPLETPANEVKEDPMNAPQLSESPVANEQVSEPISAEGAKLVVEPVKVEESTPIVDPTQVEEPTPREKSIPIDTPASIKEPAPVEQSTATPTATEEPTKDAQDEVTAPTSKKDKKKSKKAKRASTAEPELPEPSTPLEQPSAEPEVTSAEDTLLASSDTIEEPAIVAPTGGQPAFALTTTIDSASPEAAPEQTKEVVTEELPTSIPPAVNEPTLVATEESQVLAITMAESSTKIDGQDELAPAPLSKKDKKKAKKSRRGSIADAEFSVASTPTGEDVVKRDLVTEEVPIADPVVESQQSTTDGVTATPTTIESSIVERDIIADIREVRNQPAAEQLPDSAPTIEDSQAKSIDDSAQDDNTIAPPVVPSVEHQNEDTEVTTSTPLSKAQKKKAKKSKRASVAEGEPSQPVTPAEELSKELGVEAEPQVTQPSDEPTVPAAQVEDVTSVPVQIPSELVDKTIIPTQPEEDIALIPVQAPAEIVDDSPAASRKDKKKKKMSKSTTLIEGESSQPANPVEEAAKELVLPEKPATEEVTTEQPTEEKVVVTQGTVEPIIDEKLVNEPIDIALVAEQSAVEPLPATDTGPDPPTSKKDKKKAKKAKRGSVVENEPSQPVPLAEGVTKELVLDDQTSGATRPATKEAQPEQGPSSSAPAIDESSSVPAIDESATALVPIGPTVETPPPSKKDKKKAKKKNKSTIETEPVPFLAHETPEAANSDTQPSPTPSIPSETPLLLSGIPTSYPHVRDIAFVDNDGKKEMDVQGESVENGKEESDELVDVEEKEIERKVESEQLITPSEVQDEEAVVERPAGASEVEEKLAKEDDVALKMGEKIKEQDRVAEMPETSTIVDIEESAQTLVHPADSATPIADITVKQPEEIPPTQTESSDAQLADIPSTEKSKAVVDGPALVAPDSPRKVKKHKLAAMFEQSAVENTPAAPRKRALYIKPAPPPEPVFEEVKDDKTNLDIAPIRSEPEEPVKDDIAQSREVALETPIVEPPVIETSIVETPIIDSTFVEPPAADVASDAPTETVERTLDATNDQPSVLPADVPQPDNVLPEAQSSSISKKDKKKSKKNKKQSGTATPAEVIPEVQTTPREELVQTPEPETIPAVELDLPAVSQDILLEPQAETPPSSEAPVAQDVVLEQPQDDPTPTEIARETSAAVSEDGLFAPSKKDKKKSKKSKKQSGSATPLEDIVFGVSRDEVDTTTTQLDQAQIEPATELEALPAMPEPSEQEDRELVPADMAIETLQKATTVKQVEEIPPPDAVSVEEPLPVELESEVKPAKKDKKKRKKNKDQPEVAVTGDVLEVEPKLVENTTTTPSVQLGEPVPKLIKEQQPTDTVHFHAEESPLLEREVPAATKQLGESPPTVSEAIGTVQDNVAVLPDPSPAVSNESPVPTEDDWGFTPPKKDKKKKKKSKKSETATPIVETASEVTIVEEPANAPQVEIADATEPVTSSDRTLETTPADIDDAELLPTTDLPITMPTDNLGKVEVEQILDFSAGDVAEATPLPSLGLPTTTTTDDLDSTGVERALDITAGDITEATPLPTPSMEVEAPIEVDTSAPLSKKDKKKAKKSKKAPGIDTPVTEDVPIIRPEVHEEVVAVETMPVVKEVTTEDVVTIVSNDEPASVEIETPDQIAPTFTVLANPETAIEESALPALPSNAIQEPEIITSSGEGVIDDASRIVQEEALPTAVSHVIEQATPDAASVAETEPRTAEPSSPSVSKKKDKKKRKKSSMATPLDEDVPTPASETVTLPEIVRNPEAIPVAEPEIGVTEEGSRDTSATVEQAPLVAEQPQATEKPERPVPQPDNEAVLPTDEQPMPATSKKSKKKGKMSSTATLSVINDLAPTLTEKVLPLPENVTTADRDIPLAIEQVIEEPANFEENLTTSTPFPMAEPVSTVLLPQGLEIEPPAENVSSLEETVTADEPAPEDVTASSSKKNKNKKGKGKKSEASTPAVELSYPIDSEIPTVVEDVRQAPAADVNVLPPVSDDASGIAHLETLTDIENIDLSVEKILHATPTTVPVGEPQPLPLVEEPQAPASTLVTDVARDLHEPARPVIETPAPLIDEPGTTTTEEPDQGIVMDDAPEKGKKSKKDKKSKKQSSSFDMANSVEDNAPAFPEVAQDNAIHLDETIVEQSVQPLGAVQDTSDARVFPHDPPTTEEIIIPPASEVPQGDARAFSPGPASRNILETAQELPPAINDIESVAQSGSQQDVDLPAPTEPEPEDITVSLGRKASKKAKKEKKGKDVVSEPELQPSSMIEPVLLPEVPAKEVPLEAPTPLDRSERALQPDSTSIDLPAYDVNFEPRPAEVVPVFVQSPVESAVEVAVEPAVPEEVKLVEESTKELEEVKPVKVDEVSGPTTSTKPSKKEKKKGMKSKSTSGVATPINTILKPEVAPEIATPPTSSEHAAPALTGEIPLETQANESQVTVAELTSGAQALPEIIPTPAIETMQDHVMPAQEAVSEAAREPVPESHQDTVDVIDPEFTLARSASEKSKKGGKKGNTTDELDDEVSLPATPTSESLTVIAQEPVSEHTETLPTITEASAEAARSPSPPVFDKALVTEEPHVELPTSCSVETLPEDVSRETLEPRLEQVIDVRMRQGQDDDNVRAPVALSPSLQAVQDEAFDLKLRSDALDQAVALIQPLDESLAPEPTSFFDVVKLSKKDKKKGKKTKGIALDSEPTTPAAEIEATVETKDVIEEPATIEVSSPELSKMEKRKSKQSVADHDVASEATAEKSTFVEAPESSVEHTRDDTNITVEPTHIEFTSRSEEPIISIAEVPPTPLEQPMVALEDVPSAGLAQSTEPAVKEQQSQVKKTLLDTSPDARYIAAVEHQFIAEPAPVLEEPEHVTIVPEQETAAEEEQSSVSRKLSKKDKKKRAKTSATAFDESMPTPEIPISTTLAKPHDLPNRQDPTASELLSTTEEVKDISSTMRVPESMVENERPSVSRKSSKRDNKKAKEETLVVDEPADLAVKASPLLAARNSVMNEPVHEFTEAQDGVPAPVLSPKPIEIDEAANSKSGAAFNPERPTAVLDSHDIAMAEPDAEAVYTATFAESTEHTRVSEEVDVRDVQVSREPESQDKFVPPTLARKQSKKDKSKSKSKKTTLAEDQTEPMAAVIEDKDVSMREYAEIPSAKIAEGDLVTEFFSVEDRALVQPRNIPVAADPSAPELGQISDLKKIKKQKRKSKIATTPLGVPIEDAPRYVLEEQVIEPEVAAEALPDPAPFMEEIIEETTIDQPRQDVKVDSTPKPQREAEIDSNSKQSKKEKRKSKKTVVVPDPEPVASAEPATGVVEISQPALELKPAIDTSLDRQPTPVPIIPTDTLEAPEQHMLARKASKKHKLAALFEQGASQGGVATERELREKGTGSVKNLAEQYETQSRSVTPVILSSPEKRSVSRPATDRPLGSESPKKDIDFAGTVAAGLKMSGFDDDKYVLDNPTFHRSNSSHGARDMTPDDDVAEALDSASTSKFATRGWTTPTSSPKLRPTREAESDTLPPIEVAMASTDIASFDPLDVLNDPTFSKRNTSPGKLEEADPDELGANLKVNKRSKGKKKRTSLPELPVETTATIAVPAISDESKAEMTSNITGTEPFETRSANNIPSIVTDQSHVTAVSEQPFTLIQVNPGTPTKKSKKPKKDKNRNHLPDSSVEYTASETPVVEAYTREPPTVETLADSTAHAVKLEKTSSSARLGLAETVAMVQSKSATSEEPREYPFPEVNDPTGSATRKMEVGGTKLGVQEQVVDEREVKTKKKEKKSRKGEDKEKEKLEGIDAHERQDEEESTTERPQVEQEMPTRAEHGTTHETYKRRSHPVSFAEDQPFEKRQQIHKNLEGPTSTTQPTAKIKAPMTAAGLKPAAEPSWSFAGVRDDVIELANSPTVRQVDALPREKKRRSREPKTPVGEVRRELQDVESSPALPQYSVTTPSAPDYATKERTSYLFDSSPSTRAYGTSPVVGPVTPAHDAREISRSAAKDRREPSSTTSKPSNEVRKEQSSAIKETEQQQPYRSLFGDPSEKHIEQSASVATPVSKHGRTPSNKQLHTITEASPDDSPLHKKSRPITDVGAPDRGVKSLRRTDSPKHFSERLTSPPPVTPTPLTRKVLALDASGRDSPSRSGSPWHQVHEQVDRTMTLSPARRLPRSSPSYDPIKQHMAEQRSPSAMSNISKLRSPDQERPLSSASNRSTHSLRRVDRSASGDLRNVARLGKASAPDANETEPNLSGIALATGATAAIAGIAAASKYDPVRGAGKGRRASMAAESYVSV